MDLLYFVGNTDRQGKDQHHRYDQTPVWVDLILYDRSTQHHMGQLRWLRLDMHSTSLQNTAGILWKNERQKSVKYNSENETGASEGRWKLRLKEKSILCKK